MKKPLLIIASSLLVATLASCGGGTPSEEDTYVFTPTLDKDTTCEIRVVGDYGSFEALEEQFDYFNEYYPNVILEYEKVDSYDDNIGTVLDREEHRPNIFFAYTSYTVGTKKQNVLNHMEKLSDPALNINLKCLRPGLVHYEENNDVYMAPIYGRTYGMLVNKDLFAKEGLAVPTTWTELLNVCDAFYEKGITNPMMGYSSGTKHPLMNTIVYPAVVNNLKNHPEAIALINDLNPNPAAGEYLRPALTQLMQLINGNAIDLTECNRISDNYKQTLLRFFKGDVPMMVCHADTASGKKYEAQSPEFVANPFSYTYMPIPMSEEGGYFVDSPSVEFAVNKECNDLDMTNEFMRFLITKEALYQMSQFKRLVTPLKDVSGDTFYSEFHNLPENRILRTEVIGIKDPLANEIKMAAYEVGKGQKTIDEAVREFGSLS